MVLYILRSLFMAVLPAGIAFAEPYVAPVTIWQDDMTYVIDWNGRYSFEEDLAIRLNAAEAVQTHGQAYITHSASFDTPTNVETYTETADGSRLDVLPEAIIDQGSTWNDDTSCSDELEKVIIFPALAPGAVEHDHDKIDTGGSDFPGQFFAERNFDDDAQILTSNVTVLAPSNLKLFFEADGMTGGAQPSSKPGHDKFDYRRHDITSAAPEQGDVGTNDFRPAAPFPVFRINHGDGKRPEFEASVSTTCLQMRFMRRDPGRRCGTNGLSE